MVFNFTGNSYAASLSYCTV